MPNTTHTLVVLVVLAVLAAMLLLHPSKVLPLVGAVDISPQFNEGADGLQVPPEGCYV